MELIEYSPTGTDRSEKSLEIKIAERKSEGVLAWISELKKRYKATQIKAAVAVNSAMIEFYWYLGKDISERYAGTKIYGADFFARLSADLKAAISEPRGFSTQNLRYCQHFYDLFDWLSTDLYEREGKAQTNFAIAMPSDECDLAKQLAKCYAEAERLVAKSKAASDG